MTITPELIQNAKTMPIRRFQQEIDIATPVRTRPEVIDAEVIEPAEEEKPVTRVFHLSGLVNSNLSKAIEVATYPTRGEHDPKESFDDRVMSAIVGDYLSANLADFDEVMRNDDAGAKARAQDTEDALGPDVPSEEADEYRVPTEAEEEVTK